MLTSLASSRSTSTLFILILEDDEVQHRSPGRSLVQNVFGGATDGDRDALYPASRANPDGCSQAAAWYRTAPGGGTAGSHSREEDQARRAGPAEEWRSVRRMADAKYNDSAGTSSSNLQQRPAHECRQSDVAASRSSFPTASNVLRLAKELALGTSRTSSAAAAPHQYAPHQSSSPLLGPKGSTASVARGAGNGGEQEQRPSGAALLRELIRQFEVLVPKEARGREQEQGLERLRACLAENDSCSFAADSAAATAAMSQLVGGRGASGLRSSTSDKILEQHRTQDRSRPQPPDDKGRETSSCSRGSQLQKHLEGLIGSNLMQRVHSAIVQGRGGESASSSSSSSEQRSRVAGTSAASGRAENWSTGPGSASGEDYGYLRQHLEERREAKMNSANQSTRSTWYMHEPPPAPLMGAFQGRGGQHTSKK